MGRSTCPRRLRLQARARDGDPRGRSRSRLPRAVRGGRRRPADDRGLVRLRAPAADGQGHDAGGVPAAFRGRGRGPRGLHPVDVVRFVGPDDDDPPPRRPSLAVPRLEPADAPLGDRGPLPVLVSPGVRLHVGVPTPAGAGLLPADLHPDGRRARCGSSMRWNVCGRTCSTRTRPSSGTWSRWRRSAWPRWRSGDARSDRSSRRRPSATAGRRSWAFRSGTSTAPRSWGASPASAPRGAITCTRTSSAPRS